MSTIKDPLRKDKISHEGHSSQYHSHTIPIGLIYILNLREELGQPPYKEQHGWPEGVLYLEAPLHICI